MKNRFSEQHAIVIGAGIGGLAAAAALSRHFGQVTVLERDQLPSDPRPRPGVAQGRHLHGLLSGGSAALCELFPGLEAHLLAAGAQKSDAGADVRFELAGMPDLPRRKLDVYTYLLSRPLLEGLLREQLLKRQNVTLRDSCRVTEIVADESDRVAGVRFETREGRYDASSATLVVDASGRGMPTLAYLKATGRPMPDETVIGADITYGSAVYTFPRGAEPDCKVAISFGKAPEQRRMGLLSVREHGLWDVVLGGRLGDLPPVEEDAFLAFADALPTRTIGDALRKGRRESPVIRYGYPESRRRHFTSIADFPIGLLPIGDAACNINPMFGQGMTVAAKEALLLESLLSAASGQSDALQTIAPEFLEGIDNLANTPWRTAASIDLAYPETTGVRPPDMQQSAEYQAAIMRLAADDFDLHRLMVEVRHLLKPGNLLHTPELRQRVQALQQQSTTP
ncbi:NAD(P)/FAD-dependent oxidoreductase [Paraburkholderia rhizosphaerae]|uniref:2-polyprenyl-6-methoxyphenol hydroxylase-like FAD-dependent oxidoreductase n=1 Tax=Paraburkholderia rhizosphaerae TaxID=480658 RepID=A0A4R8LA08_9BURK|nr:NAD(P)-binding protein [Paraburkholderia rhizosphaerae]TDY38790.1 2-polyprenyl-6-methoxyphenol hydroxylase-like FAD-dependent oxidoreductase [Paraburkholderia rhizosphaerae]